MSDKTQNLNCDETQTQIVTKLKTQLMTKLKNSNCDKTQKLKGAWEVDQQWIISGVKQCSRHLNKKIGLPISFFLEQTKKTLIRFPKTLPFFIF